MNQEVSLWMRGLHNADGSRPTPPFFATGSAPVSVCMLHCLQNSQCTLVGRELLLLTMLIACMSVHVLCTFCTEYTEHTQHFVIVCCQLHADVPIIQGVVSSEPFVLVSRDASSVMWNRMYSKEAFTPYDRFCVCRQLKATLEATGARHMIIGHTPQVILCTKSPVVQSKVLHCCVSAGNKQVLS